MLKRLFEAFRKVGWGETEIKNYARNVARDGLSLKPPYQLERIAYSRADAAEDALRTDFIKTGRGIAMMIDAEFIVWRRDQKGQGYPSLDLYDPRSSLSFDVHKQRLIAIRKLVEADKIMTFDELIAKYPCPPEPEF